jgi:hypothetical protein
VNVSGVTELNNLVARVSPSGTIELPLVGVVRAQGLTEEQLGALIRERLTRYVRNPQVRVFTQEYRSREVGVFGAVTKPGEYNVSGSQDTVREMLVNAAYAGYVSGLRDKSRFSLRSLASKSPTDGRSAAVVTTPSPFGFAPGPRAGSRSKSWLTVSELGFRGRTGLLCRGVLQAGG